MKHILVLIEDVKRLDGAADHRVSMMYSDKISRP